MSTRFIPKEKLSKKAQRELNAARRTLWAVPPVSEKVESKKVYNRKKSARLRDDGSGRVFCFWGVTSLFLAPKIKEKAALDEQPGRC